MKIEIEVPEGRIADLLCSAWEGGMSAQWVGNSTGVPYAIKGPSKLALPVTIEVDADVGDDRNGQQHTLDEAAIKRGLELLLSPGGGLPGRHAGAFLSDDADAETGDVFLQLCIFGELIYG